MPFYSNSHLCVWNVTFLPLLKCGFTYPASRGFDTIARHVSDKVTCEPPTLWLAHWDHSLHRFPSYGETLYGSVFSSCLINRSYYNARKSPDRWHSINYLCCVSDLIVLFVGRKLNKRINTYWVLPMHNAHILIGQWYWTLKHLLSYFRTKQSKGQSHRSTKTRPQNVEFHKSV